MKENDYSVKKLQPIEKVTQDSREVRDHADRTLHRSISFALTSRYRSIFNLCASKTL